MGRQKKVSWEVTPAPVVNLGSLGGAEVQDLSSNKANLDSDPGSRTPYPDGAQGRAGVRKYLANGEGLGLTPSSLLSDSFISSKTWAWGHVLLPFGGARTLAQRGYP